MKKASVLFLAMVAVGITACSNEASETEDETAVEAVTYNLDASASTITWKGSMSPEYFHEGTIKATSGTLTMEGEEVTSGTFEIDMNTIDDTSMEEPKSGALEGHLKGTLVDENHPQDLFFNIPEFPTVGVTVNSFKDGQLDLTLSILGKKLNQTVPATISANGTEATINGTFAIDFSETGIPGFQPNPEDGSGINPKVDFTVALKMKK